MLLETKTVEKPWGKDVLPPPFATPEGKRIGEIWFVPPTELPELLVKYIFTSEKLSVQVHPSDTQTEAAGLGKQGKEECWLVIDADPGAVLGMGFDGEIDRETMRQAALDGSIEDMLVWHPVKAGDFFYIPANTVHAIGGGVSIIEIQQNSDITYRLYDYGRPRELHLEEAIGVAQGRPYDEQRAMHVPDRGDMTLVEGPWFRLDRLDGGPAAAIAAKYHGPLLVIPREGSAVVSGEVVAPGECALAPSLAEVEFSEAGSCLITQPIAGAR
ncbi:class I mannose-6-phosphate isomerase [Altererythrobacter sp. Root672]|uniref:class I mannose-6-phosphate isomerase n=1 Tax=Altererythrobacter sp. Root672 TaxID=1736584 RepID=UPI0006FAF753|nr:class I mannose-6-phosphate isomerase [Altererythrobacter sp. Root672]KRA81324.1 mannose-6-phosphate isomerase [Altererythrobacter sp. Root672]